MDFKDQIKQIAERVEKLKANLPTEEATKNALIMPFISALGYDVFNPFEVLPEMTCDIGTKKGEKIDYAIMKDEEPIILIECKHWAQDLNLHDNQLLRYFNVSKAKFGLLTNGIIYRFYTDLATPNVMDEKPFLEIDMENLKDAQVEELKKFHKSYFDIDNILSSASELKYMSELKQLIQKEFASPSPEFVKFFGKQVYESAFTQKITDQFTSLVRKSIGSYINDIISDRLKAAISDTNSQTKQTENESETNTDAESQTEKKIITTEMEMEAFYIIKSILRNTIPSDRITFRDAQTRFSVFIDDNNRKCVCRLYLNSETTKKIGFVDENKTEVMTKIENIDEIYNFSDQIVEIATRFL